MLVLLSLVYIAFVALGFPDGIAGVAWPTLRRDFGVPIDAAGIPLMAGTLGYLVSSFTSGRWIAKFTIAGFLALSCALTGLALVLDASVHAWLIYVSLGLMLGLGAGGIDAGLNTYAAANFGEKHMHWMHASWGLGVTAGPLLMTLSLRAWDSWRPAFLAIGAFQLLLALVFVFSMPLWAGHGKTRGKSGGRQMTSYSTPLSHTLAHRPAWLGGLQFFLYSGAEISLGFWAYSILTEARGVSPVAAGILSGGYWAIFTVGRVISGYLTSHYPARRLIWAGQCLALAGSLLLWSDLQPALSLAGIVIIGFAMAPIFPALLSETEKRVGARHGSNSIGMQMAAASLGASIIPACMGLLAKRASLTAIPAALAALYSMQFAVTIMRDMRQPRH